MTRSFALVFALVACVACSTSRPSHIATFNTIDPAREPSVAGVDDEAAREASAGAERGAKTGRRIGRVAGVLAAIFGGPSHETLDDTIDRYRRTRDAATVVGAIIGATKGAMDGADAEEGFETDTEFAELLKIDGLEVTRPFPDQIDVHLALAPDPQTLTAIALVFAGHDDRTFDIEGPEGTAFSVRESLIELGLTSSRLSAHRADALDEVVIHIRRRA